MLRVNIVFLPRNQNPLEPADGVPSRRSAHRAFADAKLSFVARIVSGSPDLPGTGAARSRAADHGAPDAGEAPVRGARRAVPDHSNLGADEHECQRESAWQPAPAAARAGQIGQEVPAGDLPEVVQFRRAAHAERRDRRCVSLRRARCDAESRVQAVGRRISWGQVFASAMRQPLLATALGMIYQTSITVNAADFAKGGWLYVDLADEQRLQSAADSRPHVRQALCRAHSGA